MKKTAYTMIVLLVLVGSMAVAAQAQTSAARRLIASVPFAFNVGDKTMPAGEYIITQVNPASDHAVLQLRSKDGKTSTMIQMNSAIGKAQDTARLLFHRYDNEYFFAEAWIDGERDGLQAPKSRAERAVQRKLPGIKAKSETVALRAQ